MVIELNTSGQGYKTTLTLPSTNVWNKFCFHCKSWKCRGSSKECIMWAVNSADFWRGGWQLQASFSQSFLLQFWKSQCPFCSKYPEFFKTPPSFAFWMSLKVVMAIFPHEDIFLRHPVFFMTVLRCVTLKERPYQTQNIGYRRNSGESSFTLGLEDPARQPSQQAASV